MTTLALVLLGFLAEEGTPSPPPPGPYVVKVDRGKLARTAFPDGQPLVATYYFYWYDDESGAHFVDPDGTDALTRHPQQPVGYSYKRASWHERELEDLRSAGMDFILPVYWGYPGDYDDWSFAGLPPLVEAARRLEKKGERAPRIGCFYDTSTLRHNRKHYHADLGTPEGKRWLYLTVRDFFSMIPPDLWATIEGRPILWLYSAAFAAAQDPSALDWVRSRFEEDFGVRPFIVKEVSWQGKADATYSWGAALRPKILDIAAIGPGYDHSAVPGRSPLVRDREDGAFYRRSWELVLRRPLELRPTICVIETWNEWHEGTDIAPSKESGRKYLELTREYADLWHARKVLRPARREDGRQSVSIVLGERNRDDGIEQREEADGKTAAVSVEGRTARVTRKTRFGGRYMYFDVDDGFYWADASPLVVEITFLDRGSGAIGLDYDSLDPAATLGGAFKAAPDIEKSNSGEWRSARVSIPDAAFLGRANGGDFRLVDRDGTLAVHRVVVSRKAAK